MTTSADNVRSIRPSGADKVLRIVAGLHAGASRNLADQEMLVVGSGDDCDIVLADTGVAAHHALITLVGGVFTLRALDAPVRVEGKPLHPGDPVELRPLQRIDLGEAAIAFGGRDEAAWEALFPAIADKASKQRARPFLRRLPLIAASAVLALAVVAVIAAMIPRRNDQVDTQAYLQALVPQYGISQGKVSTAVNGIPVLSGTVESEAVRNRIQQELGQTGVTASLALRTGEDMARDVREVFRMEGVNVDTRYLGGGEVEINGALDQAKLQQILQSRAMVDVGVAKFVPGNRLTSTVAAPSAGTQTNAVIRPPVDIVAVVKGKEPYVVDSDGEQYPVGARIPGHGKLIGIGSQIWVEGMNGEIKQVRPITAAELAARAAAEAGTTFDNVVGSMNADASPAGETKTPSPAATETKQ